MRIHTRLSGHRLLVEDKHRVHQATTIKGIADARMK
jgi:hypothetical protein